MRPLPPPQTAPALRSADIIFFCLAALYAWLVLRGIIPLSGNGALIDSDLQTYAQGMAGAARPELFAADPAIHASSPANSIPNLERWLGDLLAPESEWAIGLLRAGCLAILTFYCGWYLLGRWLFFAPSLAALLAVVCGITIWTGWGTFWGISHSDPVPRVFFAAVMPFILWIALAGIDHASMRPVAALASGLSIWIHGISALNCGAMILTCYFFTPPRNATLGAHLRLLALSSFAFLVPVLLFLWPSLSQSHKFSSDEIATFQTLFNLRWHEDYGRFGQRILKFLAPAGPVFPILAGACAGWLALRLKGSQREKLLCKAVPAFGIGLAAMAILCWLETTLAPRFGRLPMGHELVRGLRLLVPLAWLLIVGGIGILAGKWLRRLLLLAALLLVLLISEDRQQQAAFYGLANLAGLESAQESEAKSAAALRNVFEELGRIVPEGEAIYCPVDAMQIRYISKRPLAHSFKDGYIFFYNKDPEGSRAWLELEQVARREGILEAWQLSGARWLLCPEKMLPSGASQSEKIALNSDGWLLIRRDKD